MSFSQDDLVGLRLVLFEDRTVGVDIEILFADYWEEGLLRLSQADVGDPQGKKGLILSLEIGLAIYMKCHLGEREPALHEVIQVLMILD